MSMKEMQLLEMQDNLKESFKINELYELVIPRIETSETLIIKIRKVGCFEKMTNDSIMKVLLDYFQMIEQDLETSPNTTCKKGCCDCCANDFEISMSEFFMILNYLGVKYGTDYVKSVSEKAKLSFTSDKCIFVDTTDGSCSIYEVRPLVCRKYGLYKTPIFCDKLNYDKDLIPYNFDTTLNTFRFNNPYINKKVIVQPKRIVHWFANLKNGELSTERMKKLFYARNENIDSFIEILFT